MLTQNGIDEHCVTHLPHRSWCEVCIKARGRENAHASQEKKEVKPTIAMDYKEFGEAEESEDKIKTIILKAEESGCMAAHGVEQKGSADHWAVQRILDDIRMFGHMGIIMKGDGEPALVQVQREIVDKRSAGSVPWNPPAYDPQATCAVKRGVQEFMNQMRAMKNGLEQRIEMKIDTSWKVVEWMGELAPTFINQCLVGHDRKTPYARLMGKNSSKDIVEIGEKVLAKISLGRQSQRKQALQTRWKEAVWVGIVKMSNEHTVVLEDGGHAVRCRTIKSRPKDARLDGKTILGIVATPRKPNSSESDKEEIGTAVTMAGDQTRGPCRGRSSLQEFQDQQQDLGKIRPHARTQWLRGGARRREQRQERIHRCLP